MLADDVIRRLKEEVGALENRVEGAASLVQLMQQNQLPQHTPAANVISSGLAGGAADAGAGLFRQAFDETIAVFLTFRNVQGTGARALDLFDAIRTEVIHALCGWAPEGLTGVFRLVRGQVVNMAAGTLIYQIDFAIGDQLRIET
jgi:hypothetical protein